MAFFGSFYGSGGSGGGSSSPTFPVIANAATAESIRDRIYALIEAITPTHLSGDKFRRYRNELGADFDGWAEKNPGALRRFQVREVGDENPPDVTNYEIEAIEVTFEIRIAYPQTHRYGGANAMDRDDVRVDDWVDINRMIGLIGRGNFSGTNDCTPLGAVMTRESGGRVDYMVVTARYRYHRSTL
jgi:hypothetical protein